MSAAVPIVKEKDLLNRVTETARLMGWNVWHVPAPMRATRDGKWVGAKEGAGLADLILIHDDPPRLILAELKGTGGKLSDAQRAFLQAAKNVADTNNHLGVYLVTPETENAFTSILKSKVMA